MPDRVTIRDVAERAGCGVATVSRVLNQSGSASPETREKVLAAAAELGFEFNELGRSLQSRRSRSLAVLVPSLRNEVFAMAIEGLQQAAAEAGYQMLLACVNYDEASEIEAVRTFVAKQVDGIVLTVANPDNSRALDYLERQSIPYCLMFNQPSGDRPSVGVDNIAAAAMAGKLLIEAGHHEAGFVALRFGMSERARLRFEGFRSIMTASGRKPPHLLELDGDAGEILPQLQSFLVENPGVTAIFASNDLLALAVIKALRKLDRRVPDDIAVIGFDGIDIGELVDPTLATIVTPNVEMGVLAARTVIAALDNKGPTASAGQFLSFDYRPGASLGDVKPPVDELPLSHRPVQP
ncbi:substrate-binding domain-containing protein [Allorhizobium sp. BGMRC 0089]|uniref:substrate-binding domain-containing protein n=1 Tax=Allorhizobium sonneratiae TaxID=2934936 RepID=UPI0020334F3B|nr:substrate-binding domain-containing protein [Allorhizobium sonneratiae]MCM2293095.1 substrate-binding domain-containing protein [Allorhizobium sonneratiae]